MNTLPMRGHKRGSHGTHRPHHVPHGRELPHLWMHARDGMRRHHARHHPGGGRQGAGRCAQQSFGFRALTRRFIVIVTTRTRFTRTFFMLLQVGRGNALHSINFNFNIRAVRQGIRYFVDGLFVNLHAVYR